jgi:hypothetical protein
VPWADTSGDDNCWTNAAASDAGGEREALSGGASGPAGDDALAVAPAGVTWQLQWRPHMVSSAERHTRRAITRGLKSSAWFDYDGLFERASKLAYDLGSLKDGERARLLALADNFEKWPVEDWPGPAERLRACRCVLDGQVYGEYGIAAAISEFDAEPVAAAVATCISIMAQ